MNHIVIKIESGVVAEVYCAEPVHVTVVDHDVIEGGETFENLMRKAVLSTIPDHTIRPEDIDRLVTALVLEGRRPAETGNQARALEAIGAAA